MKIKISAGKKTLRLGKKSYDCAIGLNGFIDEKDGREGDGKTPLGKYRLRYGLYRADRVELAETHIPMRPIREDDGWCDTPDDPAYNRPVRLPYPARAEVLYRESHVYDVILVLGHNDDPPVPEMGSAIFLHIARQNYKPTQGCVALNREDILKILPKLKPGMKVKIRE